MLKYLPNHPAHPRENGLTMMIDKGLGTIHAQDLVNCCGHLIDYIKFGFGTALVTKNVKEKIKIFKEAGIVPYLGGTLFEAFWIRNQIDDYCRFIDNMGIEVVEISDGSMTVPHDIKCEMIANMSKSYTIISEVGSKDAEVIYNAAEWANMMLKELSAGSSKVIAEARESGTVGIYDAKGEAQRKIIDTICLQVPLDKIIWEAPNKTQQVWFIKNFGTNINLGNIQPEEIAALETLRIGLRGDTFSHFYRPL